MAKDKAVCNIPADIVLNYYFYVWCFALAGEHYPPIIGGGVSMSSSAVFGAIFHLKVESAHIAYKTWWRADSIYWAQNTLSSVHSNKFGTLWYLLCGINNCYLTPHEKRYLLHIYPGKIFSNKGTTSFDNTHKIKVS